MVSERIGSVHINNRPIMKVVCYERVCSERGVLWAELGTVMNVVCHESGLLWTDLFWKGTG